MDLSIDISDVSFCSTWPYSKGSGYSTISHTLTDKLCYFTLAMSQIVFLLYIRPLLSVKQYNIESRRSGRLLTCVLSCWFWELVHDYFDACSFSSKRCASAISVSDSPPIWSCKFKAWRSSSTALLLWPCAAKERPR
jgi:hypothetical protein